MKASGIAARRFYNAFYRWTLLAEAPHPRARVPVLSNRLLVRTYRRNGSKGPRNPSSRSPHQSYERTDLRRSLTNPASAHGKGNLVTLPNIYDEEARTVTDRPFTSMEPWEEVVRYKSVAGYSVEMCIPQRVLAQVEEHRPLHTMVDFHALQIDVGHAATNATASGPAVPVKSILATGAMKDIEVLRSMLRQSRDRLESVDPQTLQDRNGRDARGTGPSSPKENYTQAAEEANDRSISAATYGKLRVSRNSAYTLELRLPKKLFWSEREVAFEWPPNTKALFKDLSRNTRCRISLRIPLIRFIGPQSGIEKAKQTVQAFVDDACDRQSIPRRALDEVMPLTKYTDAAPLLEQNQSDHKIAQAKTILRPLTHPVALIIASFQSPHDVGSSGIDNFRGVTVSSLTSVTMAPTPLISFNLRLPSRTWDVMESNAIISINFLDASPEGAAIASAFTKPHEDPSEAFRDLQRLGYIMKRLQGGVYRLTYRDSNATRPGTFGNFTARVVRDKCVTVGDHVIVVAEVLNAWISHHGRERAEAGEAFGLTYANREYRVAGQTIEPAAIPEQGSAQEHAELKDSVTNGTLAIDHGDVETFQDDTESGEFTPEQLTASPLEKSATAGPDRPNDLPPQQPMTSPDEEQMLKSLQQMATGDAAVPSEVATDEQHSSTGHHTQSSSKPSHKSNTAADARLPDPKSSLGFLEQVWRSYSTSAKPATFDADESQMSSINQVDQLETKVSDESLLSTTAAEFLNSHEGDPYTPRRMRALIRAKKEAFNASRSIEWALKTGTLTAEESERLENIITRNERWIAKKVAFNSAYDLRLMLDKGKVDVKQARWLESSIEKGQAVLLEEAKQIRALYENGKLSEENLKFAKERLEADNQILATEAMRLRQMVDEEGDDGGVLAEEKTEKGFDGFKGNV